jgi:ligand-binding sensor domain-containing protein
MHPTLLALSTSLAFSSFCAIAEPPQPTNASLSRTSTPRLTRTLNRTPDSSTVHCAAQDRVGDLWFGTGGEGVYRYNANAFTQYTVQDGLPSNTVRCALADADGQLWFGTDAGLCRWNGERMELVPLPPPPVINAARTFNEPVPGAPPEVWSLLQDRRGTLWIGTNGGLFVSNRGIITPFLDDPAIANPSKLHLRMVNSMLEDREGNIWFASGMHPGFEGLCRFDGATLTQLIPGGQRWIRSLVQDSDGTLWMGTRSGGVWRYDGNEFTRFTDQRPLGSPLLVDHAGNIWFSGEEDNRGINMSGVWRYDGKTFENFKIESIIGGYGVWSITQDRSHTIWLGTRNTGLYRFDGRTLIGLSE